MPGAGVSGGEGRVWQSLLPLTWVQSALGGSVVVARSTAAERLLTAYRTAAILAFLAIFAYQISEDITHRVDIDIFYIWSYIRAVFGIYCVIVHSKSYKVKLIEFSQMLERVDMKLKLTTEHIYRSLFRRHGAFVLIVAINLICLTAYPLHLGLFNTVWLIWGVADFESVGPYILVSNIEARLKVLNLQLKRRLHRATNENLPRTSHASWIGWIFLSESNLSTCCSGPMLSTEELIRAYDGILACTNKLHGILFGQMLPCILVEFGSVIMAVRFLSFSWNHVGLFDFLIPATHAILLWLPCVSGENVGSQLRKLRLELARKLALEELNEEERRPLKDLMFMVEVVPVRFTVCRMLPLDLSLAVGITNQLTTFSILMVQTLKLFRNN